MTTANLFTPERLQHESQAQYSARRLAAKAAVFTMTKGPHQAPQINSHDMARFWIGQHTNPTKNARRAAIKRAGGFRQFKLALR